MLDMTPYSCSMTATTTHRDTASEPSADRDHGHYLEVAVDGARGSGRDTLTYGGPPEVRRGDVVWVPLRDKIQLGVVTATSTAAPAYGVRPIVATTDPPLALTEAQVALAEWIAATTASSLYAAAALMLPPGISHTAVPWYRRLEDGEGVTRLQTLILDLLDRHGPMPIDRLQREAGSSLASVLPALTRAGLIERVIEVADRPVKQRTERWLALGAPVERPTDKQERLLRTIRLAGDRGVSAAEAMRSADVTASVVETLVRKGFLVEEIRPASGASVIREASQPELTAEQAAAWEAIQQALERRDPTPNLLFGVTGSGKTEVYLRAAAWCLRHGRQVIILVPEIALTSQIVERVRERFPGKVGLLHSGLAAGERHATWRAIAAGELPIVVGPRSALFAPVPELGLIVIDEEHDSSYKQDLPPRYHARAVAEHLATDCQAVVLLGSATPSTESLHAADSGRYRLLRLSRRAVAAAAGLPEVDIVDMRQALNAGGTVLVSPELKALLEHTLARREQAMLMLNRRGAATVILCRQCGHARLCPNCDIPVVYHQDRSELICHRCNYRERPITACPLCGGVLNYFGAGTQRVETEVRRMLPDATVARWDQDVARKKGASAQILRDLQDRKIDIVVGTQLIAKGFDLPFVTAVGIVYADSSLHFPDFRSHERVFQLLAQAAGRAGRRTPGSRVVVQTYTPDHFVMRAVAGHDVRGFYENELADRRELRNPPFTRLIRYVTRQQTEERAAGMADDLVLILGRHARAAGVGIEIIGPAPAFAAKVRGLYQWHVVVRLRPDQMDDMLFELPTPPGWSVDVDPQSLL